MDLDYVPLGRTGLQVSEIAFGTWRFGRETEAGSLETDRETAHELLDAYAEAGGRFIDTADVYGGGTSEEWIGQWFEESGYDREDFVVASKVYWPTDDEDPNHQGLTRVHLRRQIDLILDRLGTDYLDVLYTHRWDDDTPARQFMRTLNGLVEAGKVNHLGASTFQPNAWKVAKANEIARSEGWEPFTVAQPRYNLVNREVEPNYLEMCADYGIGVCPWSPLAQGFLTGKYERDGDLPEDSTASESQRWRDNYLTEANFDALDVVRDVAEAVGATPAQVAIAYQIHHPKLAAPIIGARTIDQLEENLGAAELELSDDQFERLQESKPHPLADI